MMALLSLMVDGPSTFKKYLTQSFLDFKDFKIKSVQRYLGLKGHLCEESFICS